MKFTIPENSQMAERPVKNINLLLAFDAKGLEMAADGVELQARLTVQLLGDNLEEIVKDIKQHLTVEQLEDVLGDALIDAFAHLFGVQSIGEGQTFN